MSSEYRHVAMGYSSHHRMTLWPEIGLWLLAIAFLTAWVGGSGVRAGEAAPDPHSPEGSMRPVGQVLPTPTPDWGAIVTPLAQPAPASGMPFAPANTVPFAREGLVGSGTDGTLRRVTIPVLMYHYISVPPGDADVYRRDLSVTPDDFRAQMRFLAEHDYSVVSLYDVNLALRWGAPLPPNPVVLTFDDGYQDAYAAAYPILQEFGVTGTFFVITARLDEGHPDYLTWAQAREMALAGMDIESHTKDHVNLQGRDWDFLYYEVQGSIESIEAHTGFRSRMFCYPAGRWDESVLAVLEELGVWLAVTTEGGIDHTTDQMLLLRRVRVSGDADLGTFAALLHWDWDRAES
ncbi:MAG: polysaccharide deacetylase family protein [Anaerolineae bacterium]|nr:polysaccharide deacetylase family protein [Anaerolineae bacterium]